MSLNSRKRILLAKIESSYGVDPTPTGSLDAMLVKNLEFNPIQASTESRNLIKPYFGNSETLLAETYMETTFEVEYVGSGIPGVAPAYDVLLRACGFTKSLATAALTSVTRTGAVATATKTAHGFIVGDKVKISGCTETEYNGVHTIVTVPNANSFTFAVTGTPTTPATGTPLIGASCTYTPVSENLESATIYFNNSGVLHKMRGAMGTVEISLAVKTIPTLKFSFTGLYSAPTDVALPAADFSAFMIPQIANTQNTPGFSLYGFSANLESMGLNIANEVKYITLIGSESVKLLDRQPSGTLVFEAPLIAEKDFFSLVTSSTTGELVIEHGSKNGYKVAFEAPNVLLGNPTYQDSNGVQMLSAPFTVNPVTGNDEFSLIIT